LLAAVAAIVAVAVGGAQAACERAAAARGEPPRD
jgi:hypothetical protein